MIADFRGFRKIFGTVTHDMCLNASNQHFAFSEACTCVLPQELADDWMTLVCLSEQHISILEMKRSDLHG